MASITLHGQAVQTNGQLPAVGGRAPDFSLVDGDLHEVSLATWSGRKKLLSIVPSLDTPTCSLATKRFDTSAAECKDAVFLVISADLPFAMSRFCTAESATRVKPLSMMRSRDFARDYGVLIESGPLAGLLARAVVVLDEKDQVRYTELVPEISAEPDYAAALSALTTSVS